MAAARIFYQKKGASLSHMIGVPCRGSKVRVFVKRRFPVSIRASEITSDITLSAFPTCSVGLL